jgi:hypothetical protein
MQYLNIHIKIPDYDKNNCSFSQLNGRSDLIKTLQDYCKDITIHINIERPIYNSKGEQIGFTAIDNGLSRLKNM